MKLATYIECLQKLETQLGGDVEVCTTGFNGSRQEANGPSIAYAKIPTVRERHNKFWSRVVDDPESKGHLVIKV